MQHQEGRFQGINKTPLYFQSWTALNPKGLVIVIHGYGEHSGRYQNVVDTLVPEGYAVWALDHRGHGKSEGKRCYVDRFTDFLKDLEIFEKKAREAHRELPVHLIGHSMGSLVANHYVASRQKQDYRSLTLSGTGAAPGPAIPGAVILLSRLLSAVVPKLSLPSGVDPAFISHDRQVVDAYVSDPLVENKVTARLASEMMRSLPGMITAAQRLKIPTMMQIGEEDESFHPDSWDRLFSAIAVDDKVFKKYPGCRHEVYNEIKNAVPLNDLRDWINQHN
ncbi:MAG: alpha/beta hydrolase [Arenicellales bacterium]|nr:alpha/beta hydrolase [Arenicellales bacterium]